MSDIYNQLGIFIQQGIKTSENNRIDISFLKSGVYFIEIIEQNTHKKAIRKFIKI